ncbi:MAG: hypothetical protein ABIK15_16635 [Pseudomonadota bacterium]
MKNRCHTRKVVRPLSVLVSLLLLTQSAWAAEDSRQIITCPAAADTYVLFGGMGGGTGYPRGTSMGEPKLKAGAVSIVDARILLKFDLASLTGPGIAAEEVVAADLVYTMRSGASGMDVGPPAPTGTAMYGFIHVLDTTSCEKSRQTTEPFFWTEAVYGDGYVNMDNKPWYPDGAPWMPACHAVGTDVAGRFDILPIVRGWLNGTWLNNGIELKDHDDCSDPESEYGDGYSWHIASREDPVHFPYLEITVDRTRARIADKNVVTRLMPPGTDQVLKAVSSGASACHWTVIGPDGRDVSAATLSAPTGSPVTISAPEACGVYMVMLACGEESDSVSIGVAAEDPVNPAAPLYMGEGIALAEQQALLKINDAVRERIGRSGSIARVDYNNGLETVRIGGTGREYGAAVLITLCSGLQDDAPLTVLLDAAVGMKVYREGFAEPDTPRYIVVADTGLTTFGGASGIFLFDVYDSGGDRLDDQSVSRLQISIRFDPKVTGDNPFENNRFAVLHTVSITDFFSEDDQIQKNTITETEAARVQDGIGHIVFETSSRAMFGLIAGGQSEAEQESGSEDFGAETSDSLGDGCFIGGLLQTGSTHGSIRK